MGKHDSYGTDARGRSVGVGIHRESLPPHFVMCSTEGISAALPGLLVDNWDGWAPFLRGLLGLLGLGNRAAPAPSPPWACLPFLLASALG